MSLSKKVGLSFVSIFLIVISIFLIVSFSSFVLLNENLILDSLSDEDFKALVAQGPVDLSTVVIKEDFDAMIANVFAYVRGDVEVLDMRIKFNNDTLYNEFLIQVEPVPVCVFGQDPFVGDQIQCRPAEVSTSDFLDQLLARDNVTIFDSNLVDLEPILDSEGNIRKTRDSLAVIKLLMYAGLVIVALLIFLVYIISRPELKSFFMALGINGLLIGFIGILSSFLIKSISSSGILDPNVAFITEIFASIFAAVYRRMLMVSIIIGIIGFAFMLLAFFLKKKSSKH